MFAEKHREEVERVLRDQCADNLPFCEDIEETGLKRLRFAVLRLSKGDPAKFRNAMDLAESDWRDLLMAAGFGNSLSAHEEWAQRKLSKKRNRGQTRP
jgi:hypothetical protein